MALLCVLMSHACVEDTGRPLYLCTFDPVTPTSGHFVDTPCTHHLQSLQKTAPAVCSTAARIQADLELSRRLVRTLDEQKGVTANPLLPKEEANGEPGATVATTAHV